MGLATTLFLYLVIGAAVAAAVMLRRPGGSGLNVGPGLAALLFWPLFVPGLLGPPVQATGPVEPANESSESDDLAAAIERVETELEQALRSLDGWAETTLAAERPRLDELRQTWRLQAARVRELDELLYETSIESGLPVVGTEDEADDRPTERSRRHNLERLRSIRRQLHDDLLASLDWVRELVTMIHLARYTGAPASRAEELITQIAAAVEGLSAVSEWNS